ncbi:hypothetical protein GGF31_000676 [Allomyces arbusculus]|nr:hypothetical protein GGF31_000676 [Allomyces arbusculus]
MPADQLDELGLVSIDESTASGKIAACPSCKAEQTLAMPVYTAFRLHKQAATCTSCATAFTAEHFAVHRFLTLASCMPATLLAGTPTHPKTRQITPMHRGNNADSALFDKAKFTKRAAALPTLATWADIEATVFAPSVAGNQHRFN